MKYMKKHVIIEAFLLGEDDNPSWWTEAIASGVVTTNENQFYIHTLEGDQLATPCKDYIIKGVRNELYPCKKDIFKETYTLVI
jgi:hypothetical protein